MTFSFLIRRRMVENSPQQVVWPPSLRKYERQIKVKAKETGGSSSHGEARQHGSEIWIFPKFWTHTADIQRWIFTHEVGHWVLDKFGLQRMIDLAGTMGIDPWDTSSLPYGQFNSHEAFADSFAAYHLEKAELRQRYPAWLRLVDAVIKAVG